MDRMSAFHVRFQEAILAEMMLGSRSIDRFTCRFSVWIRAGRSTITSGSASPHGEYCET